MREERHDSRQEASAAAAGHIRAALTEHLRTRDRVGLVVSGGTTPVGCFETLSRADLPWKRVQVTLTDERCVPATHPDSNQGMVRERLLVNRAAAARFVALGSAEFEAMPRPFACVLTGLGEDGHFASLFPDAPGLAAALDPDDPATHLSVRTAASAHPRVSATLSVLLQSELIVVLAFGESKRCVLDAPEGLPVGHLLAQQRTPVTVVWAP